MQSKNLTQILFLAFILIFIHTPQLTQAQKPKAVIGIVVDQMRQEYLYRFGDKFGDGGFRRLMTDGFMLKNAHYNYLPTVTGPGHASIYTGTTPSYHGIISNEWYDRSEMKIINCVEDKKQTPVGTQTGKGAASPWRLKTSTITDELKAATQEQARVIGMSLKDRGAILPSGHLSDGAYWYDGTTGNFISSSYYKPGLPTWVDQFNQFKLADKYLNKDWRTLLPIEGYIESGPDDSPYEGKFNGKDKPVFPYILSELRKTNNQYDLIASTPYGNDLLTDFAKAAIDAENIGKDNITDFLTISYSSTDIIGHAMGPNSVEIEDTYLRLDRNIQDLLQFLDKKIGVGQYLLFLTADHGVGENPKSLLDNKLPGGYFNTAEVLKGLRLHLDKFYPGMELIENFSNEQVFLKSEAFSDDPKIASIQVALTSEIIAQYLRSVNGISEVYTKQEISVKGSSANEIHDLLARGINAGRSGDIFFILAPGWSTVGGTGVTHGSGYAYDTHVPVIFFGKGVKKGASSSYHRITDIAPTLSILLEIKFPSGCTGQPVNEILN
jgi:predicted AlkP superfamily pyrophosphatase or phosphodiesterase